MTLRLENKRFGRLVAIERHSDKASGSFNGGVSVTAETKYWSLALN